MEEASSKSNETLTIRKEDLWKYSTFVLLALLIVISFLYFTKNPGTGNVIVNNPTNPSNDQPSNPSQVTTVEVKDSPVLGSKDAKVTMIEFSDYQCPFCGRHFTQTYPQIKKDYIDTGKVKLVFKDFPLGFHENAQKAAEAARCVKDQKEDAGYFQMHDKLFLNQDSLSIENYKKWAKELGANSATFDSCLDSGKYRQAVLDDLKYGQSVGVQGTPSFFINGKQISGAQPYEAFKTAFDAELA